MQTIVLNGTEYTITINEIDRFDFFAQQRAVCKAYSRAHGKCFLSIIERKAQEISFDKLTKQDKLLTKLWCLAFGNNNA